MWIFVNLWLQSLKFSSWKYCYAFTANDFFLVLECFFISVFMFTVVSLPRFGILILAFCICPKYSLSAGFFPQPGSRGSQKTLTEA